MSHCYDMIGHMKLDWISGLRTKNMLGTYVVLATLYTLENCNRQLDITRKKTRGVYLVGLAKHFVVVAFYIYIYTGAP